MGANPRTWSIPQLLLAVLSIAVLVGLIVVASTSAASVGAFNYGWNGASNLQSTADDLGTESHVIVQTSGYGTVPPNVSVAFVVSPGDNYSPAERQELARFVRQGGTLVVAEDFGSGGNEVLDAAGSTMRFDGRLVRDERHYYRSPTLPVATNVANGTNETNASGTDLADGLDGLTLNDGTVVRPGDGRAVVRTSRFAYLDTNRDGKPDGDESLGSYPVVATESIGKGRVVAVSDSSVFINSMQRRPGNARLTRNVMTGHRQALFDYSHARSQPPLAVALLWLRRAPWVQLVLGVFGVAAVIAWTDRADLFARVSGFEWIRGRIGDRVVDRRGMERMERTDEAALAAYLQRRHPDWDANRVERVVKEAIARRPERTDDE